MLTTNYSNNDYLRINFKQIYIIPKSMLKTKELLLTYSICRAKILLNYKWG